MLIADCELRNIKSIYREGAKSAKKSLNSYFNSFQEPSRPWRLGGSNVFIIICVLSSVICLLIFASPSFADDSLSLSGRLNLRGVYALDDESARERPSLEGRVKLDASASSWRIHSWIEGGWDGSVRRPARDSSLFKNFDTVYQSNTPYLEFKEVYLQYSGDILDLRAGIQRFAWGRLDEYPVNDLLNPWDYTQFLRKPLEDRKIGVPSLSASVNTGDWTYQAVFVPWLVPCRLAMPDERWSGVTALPVINADIVPREPSLPPRAIDTANAGIRALHTGEIEWAVNFYHGYDPRPVFRTTALAIAPVGTTLFVDPGYIPDFHRITSLGMDTAFVRGDWSIRAEAAYGFNRTFDVRRELWGYPASFTPGVFALNPIEVRSDTLDYGAGADYRLFEDGLLTVQGQQTLIFSRNDAFYERKVETILWGSLKAGWMNQKIETTLALAYNPEHGSVMTRASAYYAFSDSWKAGVTSIFLEGPSPSIFGRFSRNDQVEAEAVFSW